MTESLSSIVDPRESLVVVAAAGTGKTYRLVRRYLKIVGTCDPASNRPWARVDEVVAVTFTRAAATEMRTKILDALAMAPDQVDDDDVVLKEVLDRGDQAVTRLCEQVASAPIDTLHGLCARLLGEFPELSAVAPDARAIEPGEDLVRADRFLGAFLDEVLDNTTHCDEE